MKRFVLVLSLMAVMAMLLAAMAVPAFAKNWKITEGGLPGSRATLPALKYFTVTLMSSAARVVP